MDHDTLWRHIHEQRAALATHLAGLAPPDWEHPTLCPGWSVKDVAAHVISNPQVRARDVAVMMGRNLGRGYNTMIDRETRRRGRDQTPATVLADFSTYADSRRKVPITTTVEPLLDVLVHTQDILRPLGIRHEMPPEAAVVAADRARLHAVMMGWRSARKVRLEATDTDWTRGNGPTVRGPIQELLMISTGRAPDPALVSGDGRELISHE
ncbi:maleylpyruvate isomerase family mycothiol-dependent enzyme [Nocardioides marmoriginsengisoli]|uniref:Maleylpyruvate isomerase family mycothiol-dependent enzyme n=1 Tax=Nocardioides marmoriginsengisoli TaxID=661483 RepID=A0A3N0CGI6_9ACTN|nr:maleylpyruvate isomerase family mycothiol-dependent enzyme [Nocardioides marmoriginsengisoli]RNL62582.1 maleylpyruvate isomerase family mycothiol-dependent enzyme [Nocardioides marmoriginsengisoli]